MIAMQDQSLVTLNTADLRISTSPAQGGKITEIFDHRLARNLLVAQDAGNDLPLPDGAVFSITGWDEAVPTVETSGDVPELGYAWRVAADSCISEHHLLSRWHIPGWRVERDIHANGRGLTVDYIITNLRNQPAPLLWAAHVLFAVQGIERVELPAGDLLPGPLCDTAALAKHLQNNPDDWQIHDIIDRGDSWKLFLENRQPVRLLLADATVEITGDMAYWGIWINEGRFGPPCLGIEPTNAPSDALADSQTVIEAGAAFTATWQLQIRST